MTGRILFDGGSIESLFTLVPIEMKADLLSLAHLVGWLITSDKKAAGGKGNKVGVRIPDSDWLTNLVKDLGRPVIVSSANREKKGGDTSPAQIRKNFGRDIDLFIENGELVEGDSSTVVEVDDGKVRIVRAGAISEDFIQECLV